MSPNTPSPPHSSERERERERERETSCLHWWRAVGWVQLSQTTSKPPHREHLENTSARTNSWRVTDLYASVWGFNFSPDGVNCLSRLPLVKSRTTSGSKSAKRVWGLVLAQGDVYVTQLMSIDLESVFSEPCQHCIVAVYPCPSPHAN